jgi:hypothetical protein
MAFSGLFVDLNFKAGAKYSFVHLLGPRNLIFILIITISFFARTPECCLGGSGNSLLNNKLKFFIFENWGSLSGPVVRSRAIDRDSLGGTDEARSSVR